MELKINLEFFSGDLSQPWNAGILTTTFKQHIFESNVFFSP